MMLHSRILRENWFKAASVAAYDDSLKVTEKARLAGLPQVKRQAPQEAQCRPCRFFIFVMPDADFDNDAGGSFSGTRPFFCKNRAELK